MCVVDLYGHSVYLCQNEYPAQTWVTSTVAEVTAPEAAPFADIDGSDNLDVVIAELGMGASPPGALYWARERTDGEWQLQNLDPYFHNAHWCASADMDENGDQDVYATQVALNGETVTWCAWWENQDSGAQWVRHNVWCWGITGVGGRNGRSMEDADFNGDGSIDFAVTPYTWGSNKAQIVWVDPSSYSNQATLTSSVLRKSSPSDWHSFSWNASCPAGTAVVFQARTGNYPGSMGNWSDALFTPGGLMGRSQLG